MGTKPLYNPLMFSSLTIVFNVPSKPLYFLFAKVFVACGALDVLKLDKDFVLASLLSCACNLVFATSNGQTIIPAKNPLNAPLKATTSVEYKFRVMSGMFSLFLKVLKVFIDGR